MKIMSARPPVVLTVLCILSLVSQLTACQAAPASTPTPASPPVRVPYESVSQDSLLAYLQALTSIQPYSGWRTAATAGEVEAFEYVEGQLELFEALESLGMRLERQNFNVFITTEIRETQLKLTTNNGIEVEVPANGLRGSRYNPDLTMTFDSDELINDSNPDPLSASGTPLLVREADRLYSLQSSEIKDRIIFLDFAIIDGNATPESGENAIQLMQVIDKGAAGLVLVTQFHNQAGMSHGTVVGDGGYFQRMTPKSHIPILHVRLEDLASAGIHSWEDLGSLTFARMTLDADVITPAPSGNLIARIPGRDSSHAVILGAHIDSPNGPGAFDDGSGVVVLLETARILDVAKIQPPVDLYLAWFGSHENGIYGSAHFAATHQDLLDRTIALLQVDCLGYPVEGNKSDLVMDFTPYGRFGAETNPWPDFLEKTVKAQGILLKSHIDYGLIADNSNFDPFNVPELDLIYLNPQEIDEKGNSYIHYSNHLHDPYETVELAGEVGTVLEDMTRVALAAALETGGSLPDLRVAPEPDARALIVATHTEPSSMVTAFTRELGMALAWEGFDVDLLPYGQTLTRRDLDTASVIVLLPTVDLPGNHEEAWSEAEFSLIDTYVKEGGTLIVTNSNIGMAMTMPLNDPNEDALDINGLLEPMGIQFRTGSLPGESATASLDHPLTMDAPYLMTYAGNGLPFNINSGIILYEVGGHPMVGMVDYGENGGQVLVVADIALLIESGGVGKNMQFVKNIASYFHATRQQAHQD